MRHRVARPLLALCLGLAGFAVAAADWPQFRGPNRDGISLETGLLASWPGGGPRVFWKIPLGEGFSQVAAVQDRLYVLYGQGDDEVAAALDARTGKQVWRVRFDRKYTSGQGDGPRSTPTVDGGLVYVLSGSGRLAALKTANGQTVWQHDLVGEYGAGVPDWGVSTSPLIEENLLIVNVGGSDKRSVMAFDKTNGKPVWNNLGDGAGYSAPIAITVRGVRQIIVFTAGGIASLAPKDGRLFWRIPWETSYDVNAATPIFFPPDRLFVSSGYDTGAGLFQIKVAENRVTAAEIWKNRGMKNQFSSSILHDGTLYGFDNGTLKAIDAATGGERWKARGFGYGSLILAGGNLIVLSDKGTLALLEATPREYNQLGAIRVLEGKCWTAPTLANGRLYLRNEEHLIALDWNAPKTAPARTGK
jgi:outer membrane protein assembly factor BamB